MMVENEQNNIAKQFIYAAFKTNKVIVFMMLASFFMIAILNIFPLLVIGQLIHQGIMGENPSIILLLISILVLLSLGIGILTLVRTTLFLQFEIIVSHVIQSRLMKRLLMLPLEFFDQYTVGDLCHRMLILEPLSRVLAVNQLGMFLSIVFSLVSFLVMMFYALKLTLLIFVTMLIVFLASVLSALKLFPYLEEHSIALGNTYGFLYQVLCGITRIKVFVKESVIEKKWAKQYSYARQQLFEAYRIGIYRYTLFSILPLGMIFILFVLVTHTHHTLSPGHFIIYFSAFLQFIMGFVAFSLNTNGFIQARIAYNRAKPILDTPIEKTMQSNALPFSCMEGNIYLNNIIFRYPTVISPIFNGLECTIPLGKHVAFVGLSGSGKSTLLKLLLGFYFPTEGSIYFDETNLTGMDLLALRKDVGIVFQDSKLTHGTILDNIIGHDARFCENDAWDVARLIGLDVFISSLPMGMFTVVSSNMPLLSGGQKQLILIAKALMGKPKLLLLDEATNSLDNIAQARVAKLINRLPITRISIAHRLSTIQEADKIMVLDHGKIVETGTFSELMSKKGLFYQLAKEQIY